MSGAPSRPWPRRRFVRVPALSEAVVLAMEIRTAVMPARWSDPVSDFDDIAAHGRLEISETLLSAAAGQDEALLIPLAGNRFAVCVDPTPRGGWSRIRPAVRAELRGHRHRFRVAHEIAHTFFYDRSGRRPRRVSAATREEEAFCDEFARALLVPPHVVRRQRPAPEAVFGLHRVYGVSVEVAARAVSAAHFGTEVALWYEHPTDGWRLQWSNVNPARAASMQVVARLEGERGQAVAVRAGHALSATPCPVPSH